MSTGDHKRGFGATTLFLMGSLLTWLADFVFVYVFAAVACARGFAAHPIMGTDIVRFAATIATLAAATLTLVLLRKAVRSIGPTGIDEHSRFIGFVALATSIIVLVAICWLALAAVLTSGCAIQ